MTPGAKHGPDRAPPPRGGTPARRVPSPLTHGAHPARQRVVGAPGGPRGGHHLAGADHRADTGLTAMSVHRLIAELRPPPAGRAGGHDRRRAGGPARRRCSGSTRRSAMSWASTSATRRPARCSPISTCERRARLELPDGGHRGATSSRAACWGSSRTLRRQAGVRPEGSSGWRSACRPWPGRTGRSCARPSTTPGRGWRSARAPAARDRDRRHRPPGRPPGRPRGAARRCLRRRPERPSSSMSARASGSGSSPTARSTAVIHRAAGRVAWIPIPDGEIGGGRSVPLGDAGHRRRHDRRLPPVRRPCVPSTERAAVFEADAAGDPAATRAIDLFAGRLGWLIGAIVAVLDPELVVIGGGISRSYARLADGVTEPPDRASSPVPPPVVASTLRTRGGRHRRDRRRDGDRGQLAAGDRLSA